MAVCEYRLGKDAKSLPQRFQNAVIRIRQCFDGAPSNPYDKTCALSDDEFQIHPLCDSPKVGSGKCPVARRHIKQGSR